MRIHALAQRPEGDSLETSSIRVLVVEDSEEFREFVCATLGERPELQIVGEDTDGLQALQRADELQPDLILLDIGLPSLNGIEVARQIPKISPKSKILFVSQESSADVVREALGTGAHGAIVIATELRRDKILARLHAYGLDMSAAIEQGRYIALDNEETVATFMVNDLPDPAQFSKVTDDLIARTAKSVEGEHARVL